MVEFDCCECGRHIVAIVMAPSTPLCATCIALPSWHEDFELRRVLGEANGAAWPFP